MRALTLQEIETLEEQGCSAQDWTRICVHQEFDAKRVSHTYFCGDISIGKEVHINHVGLIENYSIGDATTICRVNELVADKQIETELCKEGVTVGNEAGEPNIPFSVHPNEQIDWLHVHYPSRTTPLQSDPNFAQKRVQGLIKGNTTIKNSGTIRNVNIDLEVRIDGASHLEDGILAKACFIGTQVIAHKFYIGKRTRVTDGSKLYHVIATNDCKIGKGFTAENCYISHHSELFCGEACAIFAGPHTVSHHKSTLLIGGEFSFYNAGSGTNQSNHAYKLGPLHHGILARGSKTASGSHILWPMQTAPFTMIMGKVKTHPDLTTLPFTYVIAENENVYAVPGMNLGTAGTFRDVLKWKQRGHSPYKAEYDFLSPVVMQGVFKGLKTLKELQLQYGTDSEIYPYNGCIIRQKALLRGIERYELAIRLFAGRISPELPIHEASANWHWIDVAGLPLVEEFLPETVCLLQQDTSKGYTDQRYHDHLQQWGATMLALQCGEKFISGEMKQTCYQAVEEWKALLIADAYKELELGDMNKKTVDEFILKVENESTKMVFQIG